VSSSAAAGRLRNRGISAQQGKTVTIVEMLAEIANGVGHSFKTPLLKRLESEVTI